MQVKSRPLSNQEAFNNAWQHFVIEQHPIATRGELCLYRTDDNKNGCAIGCQLPDKYVPKDSVPLRYLIRDERILRYFKHCDTWFLSELQHAHDNCRAGGADIKSSLLNFRKEWNLNDPQA